MVYLSSISSSIFIFLHFEAKTLKPKSFVFNSEMIKSFLFFFKAPLYAILSTCFCATLEFSSSLCDVSSITCFCFVLTWLLDEGVLVLCFVCVQSCCALVKPLNGWFRVFVPAGHCAPSERSPELFRSLDRNWDAGSHMGLLLLENYLQMWVESSVNV